MLLSVIPTVAPKAHIKLKMNTPYNKSRKERFYQRVLLCGFSGLAYFLIKYISRTLRFKLINVEPIIEGKQKGQNYIFALWHNQFFVMPYFYHLKLRKFPISVLTSLSRDGEYISRVIEKFGFVAIRGSTTRGGESAIRSLIRQLQEGSDIAVTPDGPRGPRHQVQPGIITLAQLSGRPIVPIGYKAIHKKVLNTWDRFIIPCPFSSGKLIVSNPILIPMDISDAQREQLRIQLQDTLLKISEV